MTELGQRQPIADRRTNITARGRRRRAVFFTAPFGVLGIALATTIVAPPRPRLVWNASASAPIGFYAVSPKAVAKPGDMVIARVPERYRQFAAVRHYLPANVPLVKRIAAGSGDHICGTGFTVTVNGRVVATRRSLDSRRRTLPRWHGCTTLRAGAVLLLMDHPDSFDGRYFGPTASRDIVGKARLLWRK